MSNFEAFVGCFRRLGWERRNSCADVLVRAVEQSKCVFAVAEKGVGTGDRRCAKGAEEGSFGVKLGDENLVCSDTGEFGDVFQTLGCG